MIIYANLNIYIYKCMYNIDLKNTIKKMLRKSYIKNLSRILLFSFITSYTNETSPFMNKLGLGSSSFIYQRAKPEQKIGLIR